MNKQPLKLGIISALHEEQQGLIETMENQQATKRSMRNYVTGKLWGINSVCVLSRIGKVAAAITATSLIENFGVTHLIFTGVAGGAGDDVNVGDIVIAQNLIQHDLDSSPLYPRYEVPLTGLSHFATDQNLTKLVLESARKFLEEDFLHSISQKNRDSFALHEPKCHHGLIASGDQFINDSKRMQEIKNNLPLTLAVEMEGAAVAQVCAEYNVPFTVIRTISDAGNETAPVDFVKFIQTIAAQYAFHIVRRTCLGLA